MSKNLLTIIVLGAFTYLNTGESFASRGDICIDLCIERLEQCRDDADKAWNTCLSTCKKGIKRTQGKCITDKCTPEDNERVANCYKNNNACLSDCPK